MTTQTMGKAEKGEKQGQFRLLKASLGSPPLTPLNLPQHG